MKDREVISAREFAQLSPYLKGWMVGLLAGSADHPHIQQVPNPWPAPSSREHIDWQDGWLRGTRARGQ